jgi:hypothetical protein
LPRHNSVALAILQLLMLGLLAAGPAGAVPGICLVRDPAPPLAVPNDGAHSVTFNWTIDYATTCNQPYLFEILDINLNPIFQKSFDCAPSVISNGFSWLVPQGLACGCYYGRVSFYSDWCAGCPNKFEDQATVGFLVSASATFTICKFLDTNGNGTRDIEDPPIQGWTFQVEDCKGLVIASGVTNGNGCVTFTIPANCVGTTTVCIRDVLPPGWAQTTQGGVNPFQITLQPGPNPTPILVGNWQPILICGFKFLDQAPWPWTSPKFVGPNGQQNPASLEPVPPCPQPNPPPEPCSSPFQEDAGLGITPVGIEGVTVRLLDADGNLLQTRVTDQDGAFCFGPLQWRQDFRILMDNPAPAPVECQPPLTGTNLQPWPGAYEGTVATSPWPCRIVNFADPHLLDITLPTPVKTNQVYGCNYFFNRQPARLFGVFCAGTNAILGATPSLGVGKDGFPYVVPQVNADPLTGFYQIPPLPQEPQGLRQGTFTLGLPALPNPQEQSWQVTTYCDSIHGNSTFVVPSGGSIDVGVPHSADVRVDFCIIENPNKRRCFIPVTFTQQGWHDFCDPNSPIIPGGMVYNRFRFAFASMILNPPVANPSTTVYNKVVIGQGDRTMTFEGTTSGLNRLCYFLPQTGPCGKLDRSYLNPTSTSAGALAGETLALQMNIAYNNRRLMPRTSGYDLEKFRIAEGVFKGKTVGQVRDIANAVLAGAPPCAYGLDNPPAAGCSQLVNILAKINANYEFVNFDVFNDRGFLIPNVPFDGRLQPPIPVVVPTP